MGTLFRLNTDSIHPAPGTRLIKAGEYRQLVEANALLDAARAKAADMERQALEAYEQKKADGYQDGLEEGKLEHAEKMMETILSSVEFIEGIESTLVNVVNQSIRKIIGEMEDKESIVAIVRNALSVVRGQQKVTVRVAPADEAAVLEAMAGMTAGGGNSFMTVIADARLERDSCILESELGVVDASLSTQLRALENAFKSKIQQQ